MNVGALSIPMEQLEALCQRWRIVELALFGSVLRDDFGPDSDVDVLVTFEDPATIGIIEFDQLRRELEALFARRVDLLERAVVLQQRNPWFKHAVLSGARTVYRAA